MGHCVMLTKDYPDQLLFKGYVCMVIFEAGTSSGSDAKFFYEIKFESRFEDNDRSRESGKQDLGLKFPQSNYFAVVSGHDLIRLEMQDLFYRTSFC